MVRLPPHDPQLDSVPPVRSGLLELPDVHPALGAPPRSRRAAASPSRAGSAPTGVSISPRCSYNASTTRTGSSRPIALPSHTTTARVCLRVPSDTRFIVKSMPATLEEILFEQAQRALDRQERTVADLRARTGTLVAAGALVGGLLAGAMPSDGAAHVWSLAGLAALAVTLAASLVILLPKRLVFVLDVDQLSTELWGDRDDLATVYRRLADVLWRARRRNFPRVEAMHLLFASGTCALAAAVALGAIATALS